MVLTKHITNWKRPSSRAGGVAIQKLFRVDQSSLANVDYLILLKKVSSYENQILFAFHAELLAS